MGNNLDHTEQASATKQAVTDRDERGRFLPGNMPKTGFHTTPERRSNGKWSKDSSLTYWYNKLLRMNHKEFDNFKPSTTIQRIAMTNIRIAVGSDERLALKATIEITNRTEGRPKQSIDMDMQDDNEEHIIRGFVIPTSPEDFIDTDDVQNELV